MKLKYQPLEFRSRKLAQSWVDHCTSPTRIVHGDDGMFWIVCPADAATLERRGYEVLR